MLLLLLCTSLAQPFTDVSGGGAALRLGEMYMAENMTAQTISTQSVYHLAYVPGECTTGAVARFTYSDGATGAITAFADAGGGAVTVTSAAHGRANGQIISIAGTTNYNGIFAVSGVTLNTFTITAAWVADDATGVWIRGCSLTAGAGAAGKYLLNWSASFAGAGAASVYDFCPFVGTMCALQCKRRRSSGNAAVYGVAASACFVSIAVGDVISFGIENASNTNAFTMRYFDLNLHRL